MLGTFIDGHGETRGVKSEKGVKAVVMIMTVVDTTEPVAALALTPVVFMRTW